MSRLRAVFAQALVIKATADEADRAEEYADKADEIGKSKQYGEETDEAAGKAGRNKYGDKQRENKGADQRIQTEVERIGDIPQGAVMFKGGMQEQSFLQKTFQHSDGRTVLLFLPPVRLFKITATVLHAVSFFMRHGIEFPAQVLGVFQVADELHRDDGYASDQGRISQEHKEHRSLLQTCRERRRTQD